MAGAPAYRYDRYDYAEAQPRPERRPDIRVIPGTGPAPRVSPYAPVFLRVLVAIVIILFTAAAVRISFSSATTAASIAYDEMAVDMNTARAEGSALEVQASNLSNPTYVRDYAASKLGMAAPATVETMALGQDVVAVDANGSLSLSQSLAAVAGR